MKKLSLAILSFFSAGALSALPVANPIDASLYTSGIWWCDSGCNPCDPCFSWYDAFSLRMGFWGDYVFNRHMEENLTNNAGVIQQFSIYKNQGVLTLNWCDWFDLYGLVGAANFSQTTPALNSSSGNRILLNLDYNASICYGGGARMTLWECGCFGLGIEGQYFGSQPQLESWTNFAQGAVFYPSSVKPSSYNEWQVGIGSAYRVETGYGSAFVPYIAIKFAGAKLSQNNTTYETTSNPPDSRDSLSQFDLENSRLVGYAVGMTATVCERGGITVEGRFADERALFVTGEIRF